MPTANEKETAQILKSRELREIMGYVQTKRKRASGTPSCSPR